MATIEFRKANGDYIKVNPLQIISVQHSDMRIEQGGGSISCVVIETPSGFITVQGQWRYISEKVDWGIQNIFKTSRNP